MLQFFLSDAGFLIFQLLIITIVLSLLITSLIYKSYDLTDSHIPLLGIVLSITIMMLSIVTLSYIKKDFVSNENWKQIYTNDINANAIIETNDKNLFITNNIVAGNKLYTNYKLFNNNHNIIAKIKIEKNETSYSKKILIKKENIIINGELNEDSKITKIEYRNIQGHQRSLFNQTGPIDKDDIEGEIRITIDQNPKQEKLKQMFENNE